MRIVIDGAGEIGSHLAKMLKAEGNVVTVIDADEGRLAALASYADVSTVHGEPSNTSALREADVQKADLFIAVYPYTTQEVNIVAALIAKRLGASRVVARIGDEDYLSSENKMLFKEMGIELMFYPEKNAADEIVSALKHSSTAETMGFSRGKLKLAVFKLDEESPMLDYSLADFIKMVKPEELNHFRVIAIGREDQTIVPNLDTRFRFGDTVFIISLQDGIDALYNYFGKSTMGAKKVMIMGGTAVGEMLARSLSKQGADVTIIDKDKERCIQLSEKLPQNVAIVNGDGRNSDLLYEEGVKDVDAFVSVTNRDENNILACVAAKKFGVPRTIAEVESFEYTKLAEEMGVDNVINKKLITAGRIFKFTLSGKARFVKYLGRTDAEVIEYTVPQGAAITKAPLKDLDFPSNAIICGIVRGQESLIAVGSTLVEAYDRVTIFALPQSIREVDKFFR